jgi:cobalt-zinc-cadmium resistance protein CzcA
MAQRRVVVQANVRGNDLGSFIAEAQSEGREPSAVAARQLRSNGAGSLRTCKPHRGALSLVIPIVFAAIFGILFVALRGFRPAIAVYSAIPLGLAGGVFALALCRIALLGIGSGRLYRAGGRRRA